MAKGIVVVVDDGADAVAAETVRALRARRTPTMSIRAGDLARSPLRLSSGSAALDGHNVAAVLFRADWRSWFAEGFVDEDADFCSAETAAAWLALLDLDTVLAINRSDAELWFSSVEWPVWRGRLERAGVPVTALEVGCVADGQERDWLLWGGGTARLPGVNAARCFAAALPLQPASTSTIWLEGRCLDGPSSPVAEAAAAVLAAHGAKLAGIVLAADGTVLSCTCRPALTGERAIAATAQAIVEELDDHLRHR